jgi:hypothetical protein
MNTGPYKISPASAGQTGILLYDILENDKSRYANYTGCGNTLNANQPIVRRLIQASR